MKDENAAKLAAINAGDYSHLETESRWTIWAWWASGKIEKDKLSESAKTKILDIIDDCRISL